MVFPFQGKSCSFENNSLFVVFSIHNRITLVVQGLEISRNPEAVSFLDF